MPYGAERLARLQSQGGNIRQPPPYAAPQSVANGQYDPYNAAMQGWGNNLLNPQHPYHQARPQIDMQAELQKWRDAMNQQNEARMAAYQQTQGQQRPATPAPAPVPTPMPGTPGTPGPAPQPGPQLPATMPINTNFAPMNLPTRQSQNQLMALAAQQANPLNAINRSVGNRGITSDSGVILGQLAGPMQKTLQQGALGAAKLGIDDQLLRDEHTMRGVLGLGQADIGGLRSLANRDRIGIDARNQLTGSLADMLRSLGGAFGMDSFGSFGEIGGLF
jgi:hypothetical protein